MHITTRTPTRTLGPLLVAAVVGLVATTRPCSAFYFKGGPGDGLPSARSLIASGSPDFGNPPSARNLSQQGPRPFHPGGGGENVPQGQHPGGDLPQPQHAPEPATGIAALIGLAVLGLSRRNRKRGDKARDGAGLATI